MQFKYIFPLVVSILLSACAQPPAPDEPVTLEFADALNLAFRPDSLPVQDEWHPLDAGRLLVKSFELPAFRQQPTAEVELTLRSAGDPWDKSGCLMVWADEPEVAEALAEGRAPETPAVELLRFITPFGVGHFNERAEEYKPVYVPQWADSVAWRADITPLLPLLEGKFHLGLYIDTWSGDGHLLSGQIHLTPTPALLHPKADLTVLPVLNTTKFFSDQETFTGFADGPVSTAFTAPHDLADVSLYLTTTGHGGHGEGDEFIPREHIVRLDGREIDRFTPWRDDCASFRRFNPSSGVWTETAIWRGDSIEERIASSDYSRSGWCPGSDVPPRVVGLGDLASGPHTLTLEIPEAQPYTDQEMNFFNVAAHLVGMP
jgi:hypothetical protein